MVRRAVNSIEKEVKVMRQSRIDQWRVAVLAHINKNITALCPICAMV
jgi:hypothetical protein